MIKSDCKVCLITNILVSALFLTLAILVTYFVPEHGLTVFGAIVTVAHLHILQMFGWMIGVPALCWSFISGILYLSSKH